MYRLYIKFLLLVASIQDILDNLFSLLTWSRSNLFAYDTGGHNFGPDQEKEMFSNLIWIRCVDFIMENSLTLANVAKKFTAK